MSIRLISPLRYLVLASLVILMGCALNPASKPSASSQQASGGGQVQGSSTGIRSGQVTESAQSSSLEAFRKGQEVPSVGRRSASSPLRDIQFDFDRHALQPEARQTLNGNANWLKNNPTGRVEIEGHADDRGTNEYNLALGAKRAQAVKDYLATLGIASDRLSTISYGEELPVCKGQGESCWQRNRRAHFVIISLGPSSYTSSSK
jgi:peptidoglycan-associated lipoprotein